MRDREGDSSGEGEMEHQKLNDTVEEPDNVLYVPYARASTAGFASLDEVDLADVFEVQGYVMKSIPKFLRGANLGAMKLSLQESQRGSAANNSTMETRGWKLFFLLPRLLLCKGGCRSASKLRLVIGSFSCVCRWKVRCRTSMRAGVAEDSDIVASWVSRAIGLANLEEMSNVRQALEGDAVQ